MYKYIYLVVVVLGRSSITDIHVAKLRPDNTYQLSDTKCTINQLQVTNTVIIRITCFVCQWSFQTDRAATNEVRRINVS
jgi:hypothetical protein